ncbi:MAG TPA: transcriptional regulator [Candidatus Gallacutalibacter stercoravium]|nr:transcriptional regulator [Candidatus Gallacutalibacter stercoravium]
MERIEEEKQLLGQIMTLIANQFGSRCEVVLHDLTGDYNHSIVDIRNGHVTDRHVGGCGSNLGLEVLRGTVQDGDRFHYITHLPDGRILRSSSIYLKNGEGKVIGALCVNLDITDSVRFEGFLKQMNHYTTDGQEEVFEQDVSGLLERLIAQGKSRAGKEPADMNKQERVEFLRFLDQKGAFLITKSAEKVSELLGVSKFTFYHYLELAREEPNQAQ